MLAGRVLRMLGVATATWTVLLGLPAATAAAQAPCPDVEVVFARGTAEAPGVGGVGQAFVDAVRAQAGDRSVGVYPVNYPASGDFGNRIQFARTVVDGIRDAAMRVQATAANCPDTRIVLGGFSQGAVVAGFVTSAEIPDDVPPEYLQFIPQPMPAEIADRVAAVVLIGTPSDAFLREVGAPPMVIGPSYVAKTREFCIPDDTICNGAPPGVPSVAHAMYAVNGMAGEAAAFAVGQL